VACGRQRRAVPRADGRRREGLWAGGGGANLEAEWVAEIVSADARDLMGRERERRRREGGRRSTRIDGND